MYKYVTGLEGIAEFIGKYEKEEILSIDTETTGLDPFKDKVLLIQVKAGEVAFIFDCRKLGFNLSRYVVQLLKDSNKLCILHNAKFDLKFLFTNFGEMLTNVYDTMLGEMLITNGVSSFGTRYPSLAYLVKQYCNVKLDKSVRAEFYKNPEQEITVDQLVYSALDVEYLEEIRRVQLLKLSEQGQTKVSELENALVPVVASMELNGIALDVEHWKELSRKAIEAYTKLEQDIKLLLFSKLDKQLNKISQQEGFSLKVAYDYLLIPYKDTKKNLAIITQPTRYEFIRDRLISEFNIGSNNQLLKALNEVGFKLKSTGDDALNELDTDDQLINLIKQFRSKKKLANSFGENFLEVLHPVTHKFHTEFHQLGARSGRFSSGNGEDAKNIQNIVNDVEYRMCFIADPGYKIVGGDFSQEEYRLAGAVSKETVIIDAYKKGADMHTATAAMLAGIPMSEVTKKQRNDAKPVNFSILYGTSAYGMAKKQKIPYDQAENIIKTFYKGYPTLAKFQTAFQNAVVKNGFSTTLYGRKRYFAKKAVYEDWKEREKELGKIRREGFNHIIQGTGADIVKLALVRLYTENPFGAENFKILFTVHDEIQCMVKEVYAEEAKAFIQRIMEEVEQEFLGDLPAKAEVEVSDYWKH